MFFFFLTPLHYLSKWMRRTRQGSQGKTISGYPAVVGKNTSRWCEAPVQGLMPPGQVLSIPAKQSRPHRKPQLLWALWRHLSNQIPVGAQTPRTPIPISELQALSWNAPPHPASSHSALSVGSMPSLLPSLGIWPQKLRKTQDS